MSIVSSPLRGYSLKQVQQSPYRATVTICDISSDALLVYEGKVKQKVDRNDQLGARAPIHRSPISSDALVRASFLGLSFILGWRIPNLITGLRRWWVPSVTKSGFLTQRIAREKVSRWSWPRICQFVTTSPSSRAAHTKLSQTEWTLNEHGQIARRYNICGFSQRKWTKKIKIAYNTFLEVKKQMSILLDVLDKWMFYSIFFPRLKFASANLANPPTPKNSQWAHSHILWQLYASFPDHQVRHGRW